MSVATRNPFAILDDDQASDSSQPTEPTQADVPPPQSNNRPNQKSRGGPAARGGKYYARGGKPSSPADEPATSAAAVDDSQRKFEGARRGGRGRGRGGERGGERGEGRGGEGRGGRRPFDKHSQTGKTDSDKKVHQGWGGDDGNAEFNTEQAATVDAAVESGATNDWNAGPTVAAADPAADWAGTATADASADPWGSSAAAAADDWGTSDPAPAPAAAPAADNSKSEGRPRKDREPEEEDNTLTLSQYLAQQKEKESAIPKLENTRKANEGASDDLWKDAVALSKNEEEDAYFVGKSKTAPKARPKKEEKVYLEIEARFERPERSGRGRGRGDRGGDRGDRGRGPRGDRGDRGDRGAPSSGGRQNGAAFVNVDDQAAFPSLA